jgi:hypothetical protein
MSIKLKHEKNAYTSEKTPNLTNDYSNIITPFYSQ